MTPSTALETSLARDRELTVAQMVPETPVVTAQQARVQSVASALDEAYKNASKLTLTPEEAKALAADFPDEAFRLGAGGDPNLIYIEHAYLRQRLNEVLGVGAAVPIRRREWAEESADRKSVKVYVDLALLVRGCLVGEAIGDAVYYPHNARTSYSDALESAKSNAFRRCAKEFGVGLQAWMKGYAEGWKERQCRRVTPDDFKRPVRSGPPSYTTGIAPTPENTVSTPKRASPEDVVPKKATEARRLGVLDFLRTKFDETELLAFALNRQFIEAGNHLNAWNIDNIPVSNAALNYLTAEIGKWLEGGESPPDMPDDPELPAEIADVVFHIPPKGVKKRDYQSQTIGELYADRHNPDTANRLYGTLENFRADGWAKDDGTKMPPSREDIALREGLDKLADWLEAQKQPQFPDLVP